MLIFPLVATPLVALYIAFNDPTIKRATILWAVALGFLAFLPIFMILTALEGNGLRIDWSSPLLIALFYLVSDFILPTFLVLLSYYLLSHYRVIEQSVASSTFFYLSFFNALIVTTVASYHHYFGLYEVVLLPLLYIALSLILSTIFSNIPRKQLGWWLIILLLLCSMPASVAYLFAANYTLYGLVAFGVTLLLFLMLYSLSKARDSLG